MTMLPESDSLLTNSSIVSVVIYLLILIAFGIAGRFARKENTLQDFFLGGRGLGFGVLLLTLYATQYSGNTFIGFSASAYRSGFLFLVGVILMMGIIGTYVIYAPKLFSLSHKRKYITLSDFIQDRYSNRTLSYLISISGMVALGNYLVTNLKAMGEIAERISGGNVTYTQSIVALAAIIIVYESLGGLRSVAWTDTLQGIILAIGCVIIFYAIFKDLGGPVKALADLKTVKPDFWNPPTVTDCLKWSSTALIVSIGISMYPQSIQRIYAARSAGTLRRSLQIMVFMPLFTTLLMVSIGIFGNINFPGLDRAGSEGVTVMMLTNYALSNPGTQWMIALFITAVLAAIMSTADSALLSIASSVTQDLARPIAGINNQSTLTKIGKCSSWGVMTFAVILAINLPQDIWKLIQIKTELLAQTAPALLLGLHWKSLRGGSVLAGFITGTVFTLIFLLGNYVAPNTVPSKPLGLHAGLTGFALNIGTIIVVEKWNRRNEPAQKRA